VLASPLRRTTETAAPLGREAVVVEELTEVYLGEWEGHGIATRAAAGDPDFVAMMEAQRWDLIPGAEPADAFAARVDAALGLLAEAAEEGAVIAVTHAGVIAEMLAQITRSDAFAFLSLGNASLTRIARMPGGRWTLLSFNETSHLEDEASGVPPGGSDETAPAL
jgi:probable phosphoglycerate mutase